MAHALGLGEGDDVLRVLRCNYADDHVFDLVTSWVPASYASPISRSDVEAYGVFESLRRHGVAIGQVRQSITAALASADDARELSVHVGSPLLVVEQTTTHADGHPIKFSEHHYPAHRIHLEVHIPGVAAGSEPPGLRLVDRASDERMPASHAG